MIRRTTEEYDIRHTGEEEDRLEAITAFRRLAQLCEHSAEVEVSSEKTDLICIRIHTVESP